MQEEVHERHAMERGLRAALDKGELELHFQPQLDLGGRVIGAEALLRWRRPEGGYVPASRVIAIAEETGLIHPIGDYVLGSACERIKVCQRAPCPFPGRLAVNVSPWQLASSGFVGKVRRVIEVSGIDPSLLTLEITESSFLHDLDDATRKIRELGSTGVQFSIDDFGTGYSALAHLKKLPVHELKIDQVFVHELTTDPTSRLVETILGIAHHMNMRVIAEGVETAAQRDALASMGCHAFQGYLFSPPLAESAFMEWLGARQPRAQVRAGAADSKSEHRQRN
jgi:EAL domain-containing protein (putative c-di-GMP-specific phosphodiesterase class I)